MRVYQVDNPNELAYDFVYLLRATYAIAVFN